MNGIYRVFFVENDLISCKDEDESCIRTTREENLITNTFKACV